MQLKVINFHIKIKILGSNHGLEKLKTTQRGRLNGCYLLSGEELDELNELINWSRVEQYLS